MGRGLVGKVKVRFSFYIEGLFLDYKLRGQASRVGIEEQA